MKVSVRGHLERYLGEPRSIVRAGGVEVMEFAAQPEAGAVTWVTVGLGGRTAKKIPIQRELSFCCYERFANSAIAAVMGDVARRILETGVPHYWGDLLEGHPLAGTKMQALYVSQPLFWPHGFETIPPENPEVWVAWLVPVHPSEAKHIAAFGGHDFDIRIEEEDADLMDLGRRPLI
jgi:hypothetical protein